MQRSVRFMVFALIVAPVAVVQARENLVAPTWEQMHRSTSTAASPGSAAADVRQPVIPQVEPKIKQMPRGSDEDLARRPFFVQLELFSVQDSLDIKAALESNTSAFLDKGKGTFAGTSEISGGALTTVGTEFPIASRFDVGWAVGFMNSPTAKGQMRHQVSSVAFENGDATFDVKVIRATNHLRWNVPMGRRWAARLRAGAGVSVIYIRHSIDHTGAPIPGGSLQAIGPSTVNEQRQIGEPTFDVAPSIAFTTDRFGVELGVSYIYFGTVPAEGNSPEFKLHPIALRLAVEF